MWRSGAIKCPTFDPIALAFEFYWSLAVVFFSSLSPKLKNTHATEINDLLIQYLETGMLIRFPSFYIFFSDEEKRIGNSVCFCCVVLKWQANIYDVCLFLPLFFSRIKCLVGSTFHFTISSIPTRETYSNDRKHKLWTDTSSSFGPVVDK